MNAVRTHILHQGRTKAFCLGEWRPPRSKSNPLGNSLNASDTSVIGCSCFSSKLETKKLKITPKPPPEGTCDWIGPPDATSNIRPVRMYIPPNETPTESKFRLQRKEVQEWNHRFWSEHNAKFFQEKEEFSQVINKENTDGKKKALSQEELSMFYKKFLNDNRKAHFHYNKEWYKKNISLLWPAFRVTLIRLRRKLTGR